MSYMKCLSKRPYSKEPVVPCVLVTLILTFQPNFCPNVWVFENLPIYRKFIHDKTDLEYNLENEEYIAFSIILKEI